MLHGPRVVTIIIIVVITTIKVDVSFDYCAQ